MNAERFFRDKVMFLAAVACVAVCATGAARAQETRPEVTVDVVEMTNAVARFSIPAGFNVYADEIRAELAYPDETVVKLDAVNAPTPTRGKDAATGYYTSFYDKDVALLFRIPAPQDDTELANAVLSVTWRYCFDDTCYLPKTSSFVVGENRSGIDSEILTAVTRAPAKPTYSVADITKATRSLVGETNSGKLLKFMRNKKSESFFDYAFSESAFLGILIVFLFGIALNFSPCVLPMIPINLAILGINTADRNHSMRRGMLLGGAFGTGIAVTFGALCVISILTGIAFGFINSTITFNAIIAVAFLVLALAMLDVITIDFSRLSNFFANPSKKRTSGNVGLPGRMATALGAGAVSALVSGACVAPVLIAVLVLSADLWHNGNRLGILLPFILGMGMGAPWIFIAGGIAKIPKNKTWTRYIKYLFALVFIAFSINYMRIVWRIANPADKADKGIPWVDSFEKGFEIAHATGNPLFVYLTAEWCTSCRKMERDTFTDKDVIAEMQHFVPVKIDCTNYLKDPYAGSVVNKFGVIGFPFVAIVDPDEE